uniref:Uncharacterized protein n=1 Tax=Tetraselmis sp. GSL018 TaxID=582737 RepID=A0A061RHH7_9CHLO
MVSRETSERRQLLDDVYRLRKRLNQGGVLQCRQQGMGRGAAARLQALAGSAYIFKLAIPSAPLACQLGETGGSPQAPPRF